MTLRRSNELLQGMNEARTIATRFLRCRADRRATGVSGGDLVALVISLDGWRERSLARDSKRGARRFRMCHQT